MRHTLCWTLPAIALLAQSGCEKKTTTVPSPTPKSTQSTTTDSSHAGHVHGAGTINLGTTTIGPYTVRASRDQGQVKPSGDVPIDVSITGETPKVVAVRFWIGLQDATGSIKAKADIEDPKEPNHWHTHAEAPDPMPPGSKLWVEIEDETGTKSSASYDLKL